MSANEVCSECGAWVADVKHHEGWHVAMYRTLEAIGGRVLNLDPRQRPDPADA